MPKRQKADKQKFQFLWGWEINKDNYETEAEIRGSRKDHMMSSTSKGIHDFQDQHIAFMDILDFPPKT